MANLPAVCAWSGADFATRWRSTTMNFSKALSKAERLPAERARRGERSIWQRRFCEHLAGDDADMQAQMDQVRFNPVKHGLVKRVVDWHGAQCPLVFAPYAHSLRHHPNWRSLMRPGTAIEFAAIIIFECMIQAGHDHPDESVNLFQSLKTYGPKQFRPED
jgi:hypothetical protein